jgi:hypothetical protein
MHRISAASSSFAQSFCKSGAALMGDGDDGFQRAEMPVINSAAADAMLAANDGCRFAVLAGSGCQECGGGASIVHSPIHLLWKEFNVPSARILCGA